MASANNGNVEKKPEDVFPLFFRRPRPLNAQTDEGKSVALLPDFGFARTTNSMILGGGEFAAAMRSYPIVFATGAEPAAVAILGFKDSENLFVSADGKWREDVYVPAYVRRYPFILLQNRGTDQLVLCIDEEAGLLKDEGDRILFKDGAATPFAQEILQFCQETHQQYLATSEFVRELDAKGLLIEREARLANRDGGQALLGGFKVVDEAKFNALPDEVFLEWRRRGWIGLVYAHFLSMSNWKHLGDLALATAG